MSNDKPSTDPLAGHFKLEIQLGAPLMRTRAHVAGALEFLAAQLRLPTTPDRDLMSGEIKLGEPNDCKVILGGWVYNPPLAPLPDRIGRLAGGLIRGLQTRLHELDYNCSVQEFLADSDDYPMADDDGECNYAQGVLQGMADALDCSIEQLVLRALDVNTRRRSKELTGLD